MEIRKPRAKQPPEVHRNSKRLRRLRARKLQRIKNRKATHAADRRVKSRGDVAKQELDRKLNPTLFDNMMRVAINVLRGKRMYTP